MSQINDALKRALEAQRNKPATLEPPHFAGASPPPIVTRGIGIIVPFFLVLAALAGLFLVWQLRQKQIAQNQPAADASSSSSSSSSKPALVANVSTPIPPVSQPVAQKPVVSAPTSTVSAPPLPPPPKLQGIFFSASNPSAMIGGQTVMVGDKLNGYRVAAISQRSVTLINATRTNVLTLGQ